MDYNTIFVGMDVHKEKFSLCWYSIEKDEFSHPHTTATNHKHVLAYIVSLRGVFSENASFQCCYEARVDQTQCAMRYPRADHNARRAEI